MKLNNPTKVGYFPKITVKRPDWLKNKTVEQICSVSDCISSAPKNWIDKWKHNDLGLFDTEALALSIITSDQDNYDIYAYKMYPIEFDNGQAFDFIVPLSVTGDLEAYNFLGYDAVNRSSGNHFECSALSCNHGADDFTVNKYCLFDDLEYSYKATIVISKGGYEPGPWYIVEVYRKNLSTKQ